MITRADADASAAAWARAESLNRGGDYRPLVQEFDLGFMVTTVPADGRVSPSDVGTGITLIDRETGRVSTWPHWPAETLQQVYREQRPRIVDPPRTTDPEVQLRREARLPIAPSIAAHATVDGQVYVARGAKGDQRPPRHHRHVLDRLAEQSPQETVRGWERHAELIVCSDALHDVDRKRALAGLPPITLDEARRLLGQSMFETFQIRGPGDPLAGQPNDPCETCTYVLTQLALMPWGKTGALYHVVAEPRPNPDPARFSDVVAAELLNAGWQSDRPAWANAGLAESMVEDVVAVPGLQHRHEPFPAVFEAYAHTGIVGVNRCAPGLEQRSRLFEIVSFQVPHTADLLFDFGQRLGVRMFPMGRVNNESVLAIDERGRIFDLDQAGEWFIADSYLAALETLTLGKRTYRVRDDGTWGSE